MPKIVQSNIKMAAINSMLDGMGQRDIERQTGLSRPYIRRLAKQIGHVFPRNGIEIKGQLCSCVNCLEFFYKPKSRMDRASLQFCSEICRKAYFKGPAHPMWAGGSSVKSFSSWVKNQSSYKQWQADVLEKDGHKCVISGRTDNLQCHHILPKREDLHPELALCVDNGLTLNEEVHREIHALIHKGVGYEDAVTQLKAKYAKHESTTTTV